MSSLMHREVIQSMMIVGIGAKWQIMRVQCCFKEQGFGGVGRAHEATM